MDHFGNNFLKSFSCENIHFKCVKRFVYQNRKLFIFSKTNTDVMHMKIHIFTSIVKNRWQQKLIAYRGYHLLIHILTYISCFCKINISFTMTLQQKFRYTRLMSS